MHKKNRGISMIMLVIAIVIMIILISIIMSSSLTSVEEVEMVKIEEEIRNLTDAVNDRIANYERNSKAYPLVGTVIGENVFIYIRSIDYLESDEITRIITKINLSYSEDNRELYRVIGNKEAQLLGVSNVDNEHYYVVDYNEGEVYGPISLDLIVKE